MLKVRSRLLKTLSSIFWNIFLCDKFIFLFLLIKRFRRLQFFREDINIFVQLLFRYFDCALRFEDYLHNHFRFCFQLFSWIILNLVYNIFNCLWRNKGITGLTNQNKWKLLNPKSYAKKCCFHAILNSN